MNTQVGFRSAKFPPYDGEEEQINPGLWGRRLAEYLSQKLPTYGVEVGEIYPEDWGWAIPIKSEKFTMWIGWGHQADENDSFLCFVEPHKPTVRKLFSKIDTTADIARVVEALDKILRADPDIREITWSSVNR